MPPSLATAQNPEFTKFKVDTLVDNSVTDFDLYVDIQRHFILYSGMGYKWLRDELTQLLSQGFHTFYIRRSDLPKAEMYSALAKLPEIEKQLAPKERIRSIEDVGAKFVQCLYDGELTPACVKKAETIGQAMVDCVAEDKSCIKFLSSLADYDYYTYYHSVRVAAYAVAIAVSMGQSDMEVLRQIALGGIFHDIGKKEIPPNVLNKNGALTDNEWKLMRSHPVLGHQQISETILSHVSREIILHHHEKRNGRGYPHGLDQNSILPEVQIATLADVFDALTSSRAYQSRRTRYEALDLIKHRMLGDDLAPEAFRALVSCLAT